MGLTGRRLSPSIPEFCGLEVNCIREETSWFIRSQTITTCWRQVATYKTYSETRKTVICKLFREEFPMELEDT